MLFGDEEAISRWVRLYQEQGVEGLKNHPRWGGEHGQWRRSAGEVPHLPQGLEQGAMPGPAVGSGWTSRAMRALLEARFQSYSSRRGVRKLRRGGWGGW